MDVSGNGTQETGPDVVLLDMDSLSDERAVSLASDCHKLGLPAIAVMSSEHLTKLSAFGGLNLDDFILYPFSSEELMARLGQAIFRTKGPQEKHVLRAGDLHIDMERYEVRLSGRRIVLTYKEYQLLALLAANPGRVYTRDGLLSQVWGYDYFGGTRTVDVHIRRLRSKIEDADHSFIETIWNVGYRFKAAL